MALAELIEAELAGWPVGSSAACLVRFGPAGEVTEMYATASASEPFRLASVSKAISALAFMVAMEEGLFELDETIEPLGASWRELLAHASGLPADRSGRVGPGDLAELCELGAAGFPGVRAPRSRRVYSNLGFELAAELLAERASMPFSRYVQEAVFAPLGMKGARVDPTLYPAAGPHGAAAGMSASAEELGRLAAELRFPRLVAPATIAEATALQCGALAGVLPGFGLQENNAWGLGLEIRDGKRPHWTGPSNSDGTFGHFGQSGTFLWVDAALGAALVVLTDRPFDDFAKSAWPALSDRIVSALD
ncbi:MAG: serine hydrolase [Actinomycetota bacterium]|nr:serine hydrolase [Actinomycetota bacterium]